MVLLYKINELYYRHIMCKYLNINTINIISCKLSSFMKVQSFFIFMIIFFLNIQYPMHKSSRNAVFVYRSIDDRLE